MNIRLETHHVVLPSNSGANLAARVGRVFSRLASGISNLHVTLKDINGPRGGRDKVCMLRAELAGGGQIVVIDRSSKMRRAIVSCLRRSRSLIAKEVKRRRSRSRRGSRMQPSPLIA